MEKIKLFIKIVIEILVIILIYVILSMILKEIEIIKWLYFIIFILAIVYLNLDEIKKYFKKENKDKELFNTYYINYPKVFEIAMLINNKIKITAEESYKKELQNKENYSTEGSISLEKIKFGSKLGNEFSEKIGHEYKIYHSRMERMKIMKSKSVYMFTFERLNEFKIKKATNDEIITAIAFADKSNPIQLEESNNYYVDISNLYKSNTETNNMLIESSMHQIYLTKNVHVMLNENSKNRFSQDFATSFDEFRPIQTIYEDRDLVNYDFINIDNDGLKKIEKTLADDLIGHNAFKKDFLNKLKDFSILYKLGEMKIFSILICGNPGVGKTELARVIHKTTKKN